MGNSPSKYLLKGTYWAALAVMLASLATILLTLVDIRRGFLFSGYLKVGAPSAILNLDIRHLVMFLVGGLVLWQSFLWLKSAEQQQQGSRVSLKKAALVSSVIIGVILVVDLFTYRGVPASRILASGQMGVGAGPLGLGRALDLAALPLWLQPLGEGLNYILIVWHATLVGLLIGGLFLVAGSGLLQRMSGNGFMAHITGSLVSLTQPFCSCCSAPISSAMFRKGAGLGPILAFAVSSPMLNITGLALAAALLPAPFAILRIVGGIFTGVLVTYLVSRLAVKWVKPADEHADVPGSGFFSKVMEGYTRLFRFERLIPDMPVDSPASLLAAWLKTVGRLALIVVPVLFAGSALAAYAVLLMPEAGNSVSGVLIMAFFGTLLMVPTWTEIPLAAGLVGNGMNGLAAVALITLPAVSIPALAVIGGAVRSLRVVVILGAAVAITGVAAGLIFLQF